ncbi:MAG: hypothetical protein LBC63_09555 [Holophagales bacterium]|jgi:photosystem II stability/assembly factor-like uncharacterized protein|nr:hypothetical protein [Holophagales bacterium]
MNKTMRHFLLGALTPLALIIGSLPAAGQSALKPEDLNQFSWRWIGPTNFVGRIAMFAVPKGQNTTYYALAASGGVWKTENGGDSFEPIFEKYGNQSMGWMAIAPSDSNILYLGTGEPMYARSSAHGNGVWKSLDAGKTWTSVGLGKSHYVTKIEIDSKNPDIVYVATLGALYDNDTTSQRGLYKTTDGGKTWTNVFPMKDRGVSDFVMDPTNSNIIIAASHKTFRRTWTYNDRHAGNDLYKTTDGGATWKKLTSGLPVGSELGRTGLTIYEKNPKIISARLDEGVHLGLAQTEGGNNFRMGQIYKNNSNFDLFKKYAIHPDLKKIVNFAPPTVEREADLMNVLNDCIADKDFLTKNGIDMQKLQQTAKRIYPKDETLMTSIAEVEKLQKEPESEATKGRYQVLNRLALEILYADVFRNMAPVVRNGVVYRSEDQGETWKRMTEYSHTGGSAQVNQTEGGYYGRIIFDPNNDMVLYCPDTNTTVSKDGGKTFAVTGWDGTGKTHVDHRTVWVDPLNSNHILSANDGAASETWDGGKTWTEKYTIRAQQFYNISVDSEQPYNVMGGTQDNGSWLGPSQNRNQYGIYPTDWLYLPSGDGFYAVRDWWNPEFVYYESQFGNSSRMNVRNGETLPIAKRTTPEETARGLPFQRYQWAAPIVLSPHNPGIVYICSQFVHRSPTRGETGTFVTISPDLSKNNAERIELSKKTNLQYATIYTFAESPKKPGLFWVGTDDGNVQLSTNNGVTWTNITDQFYDSKGALKKDAKGAVIPYDRWVKRVVPSRHDENTCYVAFSGYRTHSEDKTYLYATKDLGKTWEDISRGMNLPVYDVEEDPANPDVLYLGTECGIYLTYDRGKNWIPFSTSAPDVIVKDLAIQARDREMAIGTYGRGIYIADIYPMKEFKPETFDKAAHLFEPASVVKWNRYYRRGDTTGSPNRADNPPIGVNLYYYLKSDAGKASLVIKDLEGNTVATLAGGTKSGLQKMFWGLTRDVPSQAGQGGRPGGGAAGQGGRFGRAPQLDIGTYKVTLLVDDKEVGSHRLTIQPDPMFK